MKRRILSIVTALSMCLTLCPTWAYAAGPEPDTGLCAHHTEHTDACGYIAPSEGQPCNHEHMDDCYTIAEDGSEVLDCQHTHDSECGYIQATPGASCGYECPLCPIEALIAALPRWVTEDNAETVRWQLDEILDLWRELSEDEQEQIDLSPCWDLQAALDEANAPVTAAVGNVSIPTTGANIRFTADECAGGCQGHTITQATTAASSNAYIIVESGTHNVIFSNLNLTFAHVGVMPGTTMSLTLDGTNKIQGEIGIYVPEDAKLVIGGNGSLDVSSNLYGAGIGGAFCDPAGEPGDLNCGTIVVNGGTITATGASGSAGIGGANGDYNQTPGNGGNVTINGGSVTATGGSDGYYSGAGIGGGTYETKSGCGGTLTINGGNVTLSPGTYDPQYVAYGFGKGSGNKTNSGPCELTLADESYLDQGTTLDPNGTYSINGDPTEDMIVVPTDLVYTGQTHNLTGKIYIDDSKTGTAEYFGRTFKVSASADGWVLQELGEIVNAGTYTAVFKNGTKSISKTFTVAQSATDLESVGKVQVLNGTEETTSFTASDTITVKAKPTATGAASAAMMAASFTPPTANQMALFVGDTQVSEPASAGADGTYTMTASASDVLTLGNVEPNGAAITLTAKFVGTSNMADAEATVDVTISASVKVEIGNATTYYGEIGPAWTAACAAESATVTLLDDVTASVGLTVSSGNITLNGGKFTLTGPSNNSVIIIMSGGKLTITGGVIKTGVNNLPNSTSAVAATNGELVVTGGTLEAGTNAIGLRVGQTATVELSGGTFYGIAVNDTVGRLLLHYGSTVAAEKHYAYYQGDEPVDLTTLEKQYVLTDTVTVGECEHKGVTPTPNNDGTHSKTCPYCGYTEAAANCSYGFSGNVGTCQACGDTLTVEVTGTDGLKYDGTEKKPTVTVKRGDAELATSAYTVTYADNKDAGDASVSVTIGSEQGTYTKTFSIGKATPTIAWSNTSQELTYTGQPADITEPAVTLINGEAFSGTIKYSYAVGDSTSYTTGLPTNAGTYTIKASVDAEGNYAEATSTNTLTLTIKQAEVTITWGNDAQTKTYTGKPAEITAPTVSAENGLTVSVTPEYSYAVQGSDTFTPGLPTNAGTYTVRASIAASGNLTAAKADMTLTINKVSLTITGATVTPRPYEAGNTTASVSVVTFSGLVNDEKLTAADYTATGAFDNENAGENKSVTVTVTLSAESSTAKNYTLTSSTFETTGKIEKAATTITAAPTAAGIIYGQALSDSALSDGAGSVPGTFAWTNGSTKPSAGTAQYEVTFTPTDEVNYNTATVNVSVTVAKATPNLTLPTASAIQYGQKLSDSTLNGGGAVNPNGNADVAGKWSWASGSTQPTATGDFTVTFTPTDTANYETPAGVNVNVTVNPATPEITVTAPAYQVAGGTVEVKYTVANPHDATKDDLPAVALTYKIGNDTKVIGADDKFQIPEDATVGTVITITADTAAVAGKYNAKTVTATVTVTDKIPVEITGVSVTGRAYNGTAIGYTGTPVIKTLDGKTVTDAKVTYTWSSGAAPTNAGEYSLTIAVNDGKYIGETTVNFTIRKATITITAANKSATVGSAQPELTYTVSGLASGDELATKPTLTCDADMSKTGSYPITASGAAVPNTGNYETEITYVAGTLTVTAKPSTNPGSSNYVPPSTPSTSTLPVTTTGQNSSYLTTTTTAAPTANTSGGKATATVDTAMGNEIVKQAVANRSEEVVIAPKVTGSVTKAEVSIPASTVGQIRSQTNASLTIATPVANVTIPNGGLGSLSGTSGTVTVTAEKTGNHVELTVTAGGRTVTSVPGGLTLTVPAYTTPGTVAVLVHDNGTREVVRKSVADNGSVTIPLDGSAKLEIVDNSKYFYDVPATSWAADAVAFASSHELFNGTGTNQFSPNLPMSRGMLATVLHNLESNPYQPISGVFADVNNSAWYAEGVAWAAAHGIVTGYGGGQFGPNDNITREQLAVMLWRYAGSPAATDRELHFADAYRASDWALEALRWATESGIINGKGNGILDPTGQATRAETAQMLKNFMEKQ